ncbi:MAG: Spy/CpxP family protein refolding chaperone [Pirellulaceae bacterium]
MKCILNLLVLTILVGVVAPLIAAEEPAKPKKPAQREARQRNQAAGPLNAVMKLDLTSEQKEKIEAIRKAHMPALQELNKKVGMTPELRKKMMEIMKEGREQGLKGKKLQEFVAEKSPLSAEQQEAQAEVRKATAKLREEVGALLTDEQREKLGNAWKKAKAKPKKEA